MALFGKVGTTKRLSITNQHRYDIEGFLIIIMIPSDKNTEGEYKKYIEN